MIEIIGRKFNRLTAIKKVSKHLWLFKCICGKIKNIDKSAVVRERVKSCGCIKGTHHKSDTKIYKLWQSMKGRCLIPGSNKYEYYGGRGITVCKRWLKFKNFYKDMGDRPEGLTLDRINNNKGYSPSNCKWATKKEQMRNKRDNHLLTFKGKNSANISVGRRNWIKRQNLTDCRIVTGKLF